MVKISTEVFDVNYDYLPEDETMVSNDNFALHKKIKENLK